MENNKNKVLMNPDNCVEVVFIGHQTGETFNDTYKMVLPLINKLKSEGKPLLGLFDLTEHTGYSLSSDTAALKFLENTDYDKIAMYHVPHAEVTKGIIMAIGKSDNTKLFDSRSEAVKWLLS
jgi:hypothetical protein